MPKTTKTVSAEVARELKAEVNEVRGEMQAKGADESKGKKAPKAKTDDGRGIPTTADVPKPVGVTEPAATKPAPTPKKKAAPAPAEAPAPESAKAPVAGSEVKSVKPLGRSMVATLAALSAKGKLTRQQIAEAIGIGSGFTSLLGHIDPEKREPGSLAARGLIAPEAVEGVTVWAITDAGKEALKAATAKQ